MKRGGGACSKNNARHKQHIYSNLTFYTSRNLEMSGFFVAFVFLAIRYVVTLTMGWNKQNRLTPVLWKVQNELSTQQQGHLTEGFQFHFYGIWFLSACNMSPVLSTPSILRQLYKLLFKLHSVLVLGGEKYNWDWTGALKSALKLQFGGHMQGESCPKKQKSFAEK